MSGIQEYSFVTCKLLGNARSIPRVQHATIEQRGYATLF
jgi:hypothetical protein